MNKFSFVIHS